MTFEDFQALFAKGPVRISRDDDELGERMFGELWPRQKAAMEPGVYEMSFDMVDPRPKRYSSPMAIHPIEASETGNGQLRIRVEGDEHDQLVERLAAVALSEAPLVVTLDVPKGTWQFDGYANVGGVGFFDLTAVEAPAPSDSKPDLFKGVPADEVAALPRLSEDEITEAVDKGPDEARAAAPAVRPGRRR